MVINMEEITKNDWIASFLGVYIKLGLNENLCLKIHYSATNNYQKVKSKNPSMMMTDKIWYIHPIE